MGYSDIRTSLNRKRRDIMKLKQKENKKKEELKSIDESRSQSSARYNKEVTLKKQQAETVYLNSVAQPIRVQLDETQKAIQVLTQQYDEEIANVNMEKAMESCSDQASIMKEIKEASDRLRTTVEESLGTRFYTELESQLSSQQIDLSEEKLDTVIEYFNQSINEIEELANKGDSISKFFRKLQAKIMGVQLPGNTEDSRYTIVIALFTLALLVLFFKFLYPIYVVVICVLCFVNIKRSYKILKILLIHKTVKDNVSAIEDLLHQKLLEEVERQQRELTEEFETQKTALETNMMRLQEQLKKSTEQAKQNFHFDSSDAIERVNQEQAAIEQQAATISTALQEIGIELASKNAELEELKGQLQEALDGIKDQYLAYEDFGKSKAFSISILCDIDEKDQPVEFKLPNCSSLFLFDDRADVSAFLRLVFLEMRGQIDPSLFSINVYDPVTMGMDFLYFKLPEREDKLGEAAFKILNTEEDLTTLSKEMETELPSRIKNVKTEFKNIEDYNSFMLEIESMVLPYVFNIFINVDAAQINKPIFTRVFKNGGEVGVFNYIFMAREVFESSSNNAKAILDCFDKFYVLGENGPQPRALDWCLEQLKDKTKGSL